MSISNTTIIRETFSLDSLFTEFRDLSPNVEKSEIFAQIPPLQFQNGYLETRKMVQPALQRIIQTFFDTLVIPNNPLIAESGYKTESSIPPGIRRIDCEIEVIAARKQ